MNRSEYNANRQLSQAHSLAAGYANVATAWESAPVKPRKPSAQPRRVMLSGWLIVAAVALLAALPVLARAAL